MLTTRNNKKVFHLNIVLSVLAVLLMLLVSGSARAQQCSQILQHGIYDVSKTSSQEGLVESYLQALSKQEVRTEQEARNLKLGVTLPTEVPTPAELGLSGSSSKTYGQALSEYLSTHSDYRRKFNQEILKASADIVGAWKECVTKEKGLICWAQQTKNPSEILLRMELRLRSLHPAPITIKEIDHGASVGTEKKFEGEELSPVNVFPIIFTRGGPGENNAVNFTVKTSDPDYRCDADAPAISSPPIATSSVIQEINFVLPMTETPSSCTDPGNTDRVICTWLTLQLAPKADSSEFQISLALKAGMDKEGCSHPHRNAEVVLSCGNNEQRSGQLGQNNVEQWTQDYSLMTSCQASGTPVTVKVAIHPLGCTKVTLNSGELKVKEVKH